MSAGAILALLAVLGIGAVAVAASSSGYKSGDYGPDYGTGEAGGNYRLAVINGKRGQSCATCGFARQKARDYQGTGTGDLYCAYWKTAVGSAYVCDEWKPR